jgi:demethylmenaquinone methyltransferase/2-methoxy-6-polyprenyl-1,4-benzoquinol methylase
MQHTGVAIESFQPQPAAPVPSRTEIHRFFDRIARKYDFLNRVFSFGQDVVWRKSLARLLKQNNCRNVLDLATGTADVLLSAFRYNDLMQAGMGIDLADEMLNLGRQKLAAASLAKSTLLVKADALELPVEENAFDAATIAFGIRNVVDVTAALNEMYRVLKPSGKVFILEFALPPNPFLRTLFIIYLRYVIPMVGGFVSGSHSAYKYLNETVESFPYGRAFVELMEQSGFQEVKIHRLTFGVALIYEGTK